MLKSGITILAIAAAVCFPIPGRAAVEQKPPVHVADSRRVPDEEIVRRGDAYFRLMHAFIAAGKGHMSEAMSDLREAIRLQPESADIRVEVASLLLLTGRTEEGERQARRALELDPESGKALRMLANLALEQARKARNSDLLLREGISLFERVVKLPDATPEEFHDLARMKMSVGEIERAMEVIRDLLKLHPDDAVGMRILVTGLMHLDRQEEAIGVLFRYLEENPHRPVNSVDFGELINVLEKYLRESGAWQKLVDRGEALLAAQPDAGVLHALYGEAMFNMNRFAEASVSLESALALGYDQPLLRYRLASSYAEQGRNGDAIELLHLLVRQFPDNIGVQLLIGEVQARMGNSESAVESMYTALEAMGDDPRGSEQRDALRRRIASLHLSIGRYDEVSETLDTQEDPESAETLEIRARLAFATGRLGDARQIARRLNLAGQNGAGWLIEAESYAIEGKLAKARARFEEASAILGNGVLVRAAELFKEHGHEESGLAILNGWVEKEPSSADAHFSLGAYLDRIGRFDSAEVELRKAIMLRQGHAQALNYLGYSLADRNIRLDDAHELIARALELDPWNGAYLDSMGWVLFRMGRFTEARSPLEQAVREYPGDATIQEHLGDTYERLGLLDDALHAWQRALQSGGEDEERLRSKIRRHSSGSGMSPGTVNGNLQDPGR